MESLKNLLNSICKELVDNPSEVNVYLNSSGSTYFFNIVCSDKEFGKIIGKNGDIIKCLKRLSLAIGSKHKVKVFLEAETSGDTLLS